jgi:ribosome-associated protein
LAELNQLTPPTVSARVARAAEILDDLKLDEITVLDVRGVTDFTDFFIIATARSRAQMHAGVHRVLEGLRKVGLRPFSPPEDESPNWTVIDYGDFVVHLFEDEARRHYRLEELWGDATEWDWRQEATA